MCLPADLYHCYAVQGRAFVSPPPFPNTPPLPPSLSLLLSSPDILIRLLKDDENNEAQHGAKKKKRAHSLINEVEISGTADGGIIEAGDGSETQFPPVLVVGLQAVVPSSLDVERHQVLAPPVARLEQVLGQLDGGYTHVCI